MKLTNLSAIALLAAVGMAEFKPAALRDDDDDRTFEKVKLTPPLNWVAGKSLFPGNVIAGFNAELPQYTAESWAAYVLGQCKGYEACTSTISNQATNSGTPKERYWFGYVFRGGPTTEKDYVRDLDVTDSIAYTIVLKDDDKLQNDPVAVEL